ncbi:MAG: twin-arginine translocation signal domain-containing protein, partial [Planctomycetota bacterium]
MKSSKNRLLDKVPSDIDFVIKIMKSLFAKDRMMGAKCAGHGTRSADSGNQDWIITRRVFLKASAASLAGLAVAPLSCIPQLNSRSRGGTTRFGIVTDSHYADADTIGSRFYRHSLDKLTECVELM